VELVASTRGSIMSGQIVSVAFVCLQTATHRVARKRQTREDTVYA